MIDGDSSIEVMKMHRTIKSVARVAEWSAVLLLLAIGITAGMWPTIALNPLGTIVCLAIFFLGMLAALVAIFCWIAQCVNWLRRPLEEQA